MFYTGAKALQQQSQTLSHHGLSLGKDNILLKSLTYAILLKSANNHYIMWSVKLWSHSIGDTSKVSSTTTRLCGRQNLYTVHREAYLYCTEIWNGNDAYGKSVITKGKHKSKYSMCVCVHSLITQFVLSISNLTKYSTSVSAYTYKLLYCPP